MVLGHHVHAHAPCTLCSLITLYLQLYLHKSYVHETRQGSFLWQKTNTHKNQIILSKRFFPVMIFFHLWVLQLILHRATIRLLFLVKEKELPILTFLIFIWHEMKFMAAFDNWILFQKKNPSVKLFLF